MKKHLLIALCTLLFSFTVNAQYNFPKFLEEQDFNKTKKIDARPKQSSNNSRGAKNIAERTFYYWENSDRITGELNEYLSANNIQYNGAPLVFDSLGFYAYKTKLKVSGSTSYIQELYQGFPTKNLVKMDSLTFIGQGLKSGGSQVKLTVFDKTLKKIVSTETINFSSTYDYQRIGLKTPINQSDTFYLSLRMLTTADSFYVAASNSWYNNTNFGTDTSAANRRIFTTSLPFPGFGAILAKHATADTVLGSVKTGFDFIITPKFSYALAADFTVSKSTGCKSDTFVFTNKSHAFNPLLNYMKWMEMANGDKSTSNSQYVFGSGDTLKSATENTSKVFSADGAYNVRASTLLLSWGGKPYQDSTFLKVNVGVNPKIAFTFKHASCSQKNGEISLGEVAGCNPPYTFSVDASAFTSQTLYSDLSDGTHKISFKGADGFPYDTNIVIQNVAPTALATTVVNETCSIPGKLTIGNVTGGKAPFLFSFNGSDYTSTKIYDNLKGGDFALSVKDSNGCVFNAPNVVITPAVISIKNVYYTVTDASCAKNNGAIKIDSVIPKASYSYVDLNTGSFGSSTSTLKNYTALLPKTYVLKVRDSKGCIFTVPDVTVKNIAITAVDITKKDASCVGNDGEIYINSVTGGKPPYTYSLDSSVNYVTSTSFTKLAVRKHTISVKDSNLCIFKAPVIDIISPTNLPTAVEYTKINATCSDSNGSVNITKVIGGEAPYLYSLKDTIFRADSVFVNLLPKTYKLKVKDAKGCIFNAPDVIVGDKAGANKIGVVEKHETCSQTNGQVTLGVVVGGEPPYKYRFGNTNIFSDVKIFTALDSGVYKLSVKDNNGCIYNAPDVKIIDQTGPTAVVVTTKNSGCAGNSGTVSIGAVTAGKAPYQYNFNNLNFSTTVSYTGLNSGKYSLIVKDANECEFKADSILVDSIYTIKSIIIDSVISPTECRFSSSGGLKNDGRIVLGKVNGGTKPYLYNFNEAGFKKDSVFAQLFAETYKLSVKDSNGCILDTTVSISDRNAPTNVDYTITDATCDSVNAKIAVGTVIGGTSPYLFQFDTATSYTPTKIFENLAAKSYKLNVRDNNGCLYNIPLIKVSNIKPTEVKFTVTNASCSILNGKIQIDSVIGGKAPYTYAINSTKLIDFTAAILFENKKADTYTVVAKDANGCNSPLSNAVITNIAGPTGLKYTKLDVNCVDSGFVLIDSVIGGKAPYSFKFGSDIQFSNKVVNTNLLANTYALIVKDANNCEFKDSVIISKLEPTDLKFTVVDASCGESNGQVKITGVTGGLAPFLYKLDTLGYASDSVYTKLNSVAHKLSVKDANGCEFKASDFTISNQVPVSSVNVTSKDVVCSAGSGQVSIGAVTGGKAPYQFNLNNQGFSSKTNYTGLNSGTFELVVKDSNNCIFNAPAVELNDYMAPSAVSVTPKDESCSLSNGIIAIGDVTGGKAPYLYNLNGFGFTSTSTYNNLPAGNYNLIIKDDNGCIYTAPLVRLVDTKITAVSVTSKDANCSTSNGQVAIGKVTGGKAPYKYNFNNLGFNTALSFNTLKNGVYTLVVKDSLDCVYNAPDVVINDQSAPTAIAVSKKDASCSADNGQVILGNVTSGKAPYQYNFNNAGYNATLSYSGLKFGSYTLAVKDSNGCVYNAPSIAIANKTAPTAVAVTSKDEVCSAANGEVTIGVVTGGTAPFLYNLNNMGYTTSTSYTNLIGGNIVLIVKDANDCIFNAPVVKVANIKPNAVVVSNTMASCNKANGIITLGAVTGGKEPYTFSFNNAAFDANNTFTDLRAGTFSISIKDANNCVFNAPSVVLEDSCKILSGIKETQVNKVISVYPNPANDFITVKLTKVSNASFVIYDLTGKAVLSSNLNSMINTIDVSALEKGFYVYKISLGDKEGTTGKFSIVK